ncbi:hypothetical protein LCGC14_0621880 [marine sediment metagenome]|uniref:Uncharacterized protein n=1 Tax=marine sediment metagenome TaxID=412755 RepID=A0A0F9TQW0_9ZZZZ
MDSMADQISDLPEEQQEQFYEYVQNRCRRIYREQIRNRIEKEIDNE